jgi:hypothetical protein
MLPGRGSEEGAVISYLTEIDLKANEVRTTFGKECKRLAYARLIA